MMNETQLRDKLGAVLLFCGVETLWWSPGQWDNVASFCRHHGIDSVLVKVNDGANLWYGGYAGIDSIRSRLLKDGVGVIPYGYLYGNKFGGLANECGIASECLKRYGYYCADMEAEWNNNVSWAKTFASKLKNHPGILLCSTWADPELQGWLPLVDTLSSVFDAWMPQEYTNFLSTTEHYLRDHGVHNMVPTVYVGHDMPGNTVLSVAQDIHNRGHKSISLWYDGFAINDPVAVDRIVHMFSVPKPKPGPSKEQLANMDKQLAAVWKSGPLGDKAPSDSGIAKLVQSRFHEEKLSACFPLTEEIDTVDWNGQPIKWQSLSNGTHAEWNTKTHVGKLYDCHNKEI
jgi:hypothetical protein